MTKFYSKTSGGFYAEDVHTEDQIPKDAVEISDELHAALLLAQSQGQMITMGEAGLPVSADRPAPMPAQVAASLSREVQAHLDVTARTLGYDSILAAISYADEPSVPQFQAEGATFRAWRSAAWAAANVVLDAVAAGGTAPPADQLIASLPKFTAPA